MSEVTAKKYAEHIRYCCSDIFKGKPFDSIALTSLLNDFVSSATGDHSFSSEVNRDIESTLNDLYRIRQITTQSKILKTAIRNTLNKF